MLPWVENTPLVLTGDSMFVSIGVFRDPTPVLLAAHGIGLDAILSVHLSQALTSAKDVQASVGLIKRSVDKAVAQLRPKTIDLFYAGPAVLAVALGLRWNGLPPTMLHEFLSAENRYQLVCGMP